MVFSPTSLEKGVRGLRLYAPIQSGFRSVSAEDPQTEGSTLSSRRIATRTVRLPKISAFLQSERLKNQRTCTASFLRIPASGSSSIWPLTVTLFTDNALMKYEGAALWNA